ncbi:MAG: nucleotidyltransferase domain-containing protein [Candidatus Electryonea clarkiae]|nr:nucleotidyltransferase domain-containing protein [Candidatus Electryonea clarkiae]MDP8289294.1 nucleotidyltransferase domain-containing protein [Candidatus Electryonea clarkiae]
MDNRLSEIVDKILKFIKPVIIYLFGSRVEDDADKDSDYDLVVIYDGNKSKRDVKLGIYHLFPHPDFSLDIFVLSPEELNKFKHVANTLEREITENGIILYG